MKEEANAVFLFIAELTGSFVPGSGTEKDKINCGKLDYIKNNIHELNLDNEEDRKDLHEVVWLERLYNELDRYFKVPNTNAKEIIRGLSVATTVSYRKESFDWTVPIECDASASMLQYMGILLNDKRLMEMTNVIGDTLEDPWQLEGMSRLMLKTAATPMLYASSKSCHELWQDKNIEYTAEDIALYSKEMADGAFGVANLFKEFIVNNCNPQAVMELNIWNEKFEVSCNRFRNVGEKTKAYKIWDSIDKRYNIILHTDTRKVPDLKQFRRFFVTGLIHHLDSRVMDVVMEKTMEKHGWGIPIHDAAVISPAAASDVRKWYAEELEAIHADRGQILTNYFKSIGITSGAQSQWKTLMSKVVPFEGELKVNHMALK